MDVRPANKFFAPTGSLLGLQTPSPMKSFPTLNAFMVACALPHVRHLILFKFLKDRASIQSHRYGSSGMISSIRIQSKLRRSSTCRKKLLPSTTYPSSAQFEALLIPKRTCFETPVHQWASQHLARKGAGYSYAKLSMLSTSWWQFWDRQVYYR